MSTGVHLTDDQGWRIEIKKYPKLCQIGARRDSTQLILSNKSILSIPPFPTFYAQIWEITRDFRNTLERLRISFSMKRAVVQNGHRLFRIGETLRNLFLHHSSMPSGAFPFPPVWEYGDCFLYRHHRSQALQQWEAYPGIPSHQ